eukprot:11239160-Alexandrium_andersonii.AAC.1
MCIRDRLASEPWSEFQPAGAEPAAPCRAGCNCGASASASSATTASTAEGVGRPPNRLCASAPR